MERIGYILLGLAAAFWVVAIIAGMILAFPWGLVGLIAIVGVGLLFIKVLGEHLKNKEDDHYSKTVDK